MELLVNKIIFHEIVVYSCKLIIPCFIIMFYCTFDTICGSVLVAINLHDILYVSSASELCSHVTLVPVQRKLNFVIFKLCEKLSLENSFKKYECVKT